MLKYAVNHVPWRLIGYVAAAIIALAAINHGLQFVPFSPQWHSKRAVAKVERLEGDVSRLEREATGNAEIGRATEIYHTREVVVRDATSRAIADARNAPDADTPLSDERASRLRAADERLCQQLGHASCAAAVAP